MERTAVHQQHQQQRGALGGRGGAGGGALPPPPPSHPPIVSSALTNPTPSSAETIFVSPAAATGSYNHRQHHQEHLQQQQQQQQQHHQLRHQQQQQSAAAPGLNGATTRRRPKRAASAAARGEIGVVVAAAGKGQDEDESESPSALTWGGQHPRPAPAPLAKTDGSGRNGHAPPPRPPTTNLGVALGVAASPDDDDRDSSSASPTADADSQQQQHARKKQKRNKPTLSCFECVERKTKCDRGRPHCLACIKRQTDCQYAHVANLLEETTRSATNGRRMTRAPKKRHDAAKHTMPNAADRGFDVGRLKALGSVATSTGLLSNVPYSSPGASNVFGIGSEHPFANYWTCEGGLPEVISVLPDKLQADILLNRYFECVDPVYPMLHRQTYYIDYEHFWSLPRAERDRSDAAFVALTFVMLALGTQFVTSTSPRERKQTAEFYASASNQALRMCSYLSTASIRTIQAMVLITYFLINDNHASDGWAFAGILMRQAYAMGLHRDPNIVVPDAPPYEKQQRRKVWQAVLLQDTFLTVLLSLPPSATHTDVNVDDLITGDEASIAADDPTDTAYVRGSWTLANLVQETICSPRSLDVPICATARHKSKLVADFRAVYRSFPDVFRSWDPEALALRAQTDKRVVRQTLFLSSNYFHNLMLVHASESGDVPVNVRGTLEAAHDAITAFFVLFALFEAEARVWWVFNHRAFLEALCIGNVLKEVAKEGGGGGEMGRDPLFVRARADIHRMIQIMQAMSDGEQGSQTARTRVQVLSELLL